MDDQPNQTARNDVQPNRTARNDYQPNRTTASRRNDAATGRTHARTKETLAILKIGDESLPNQPEHSTGPSPAAPRWASYGTLMLMLSTPGGTRALPWFMTLLWLATPTQAGGRGDRSAPFRPAPYNNQDQGPAEDRINTYVEVIINPLHERSAALPWGSTINSSQRLPPSWLARRQNELFTSNGTFPSRAVPMIFVRAYSSSNLHALETELNALRLNRQITTFHHASHNQTAALRPLVTFTIPRLANRQPPLDNANRCHADLQSFPAIQRRDA